MSEKRKAKDALDKDNLSVTTGAGGFIAGSLIGYFLQIRTLGHDIKAKEHCVSGLCR
jgi:hypothetical protein